MPDEIEFSAPLPLTYTHGRFGTLTYDPALAWYVAPAIWAGSAVQLQFSAENETELETTLRVADALWDDQSGWSERIEARAVQDLLDLKNGEWLDEDEAALTPEAFKGRMRLTSVVVLGNGKFEFFHDDGELFAGHTILVYGNLVDGPTGADIPG